MIGGNQLLIECLKAWLADAPELPFDVQHIKGLIDEVATTDGASLSALGFVLNRYGFYKQLEQAQVARLRKYQHFLAANNAGIFKELNSFLDEMSRENISVMLLKGLALISEGVYPEKGLRLLSDMDVYVRKQDISKVESILDRMGWRQDERECELHEKHHLPARKSPRGSIIEVHFAFSRIPLDMDAEEIWNRARVSDERPTVRIPMIEDTLVQLVINAALHHPERLLPLHLRFLVDFAFIWKYANESLDWEYINGRIERAGLVVPFWNAISICCRLLDPAGSREVLDKYNAAGKADLIFVDMMISNILSGDKHKDLSWLVILAAEEKNPFKRILKSVQVIFPPRSFMAEAYPKWNGFPKIFVAYIARLIKVTRKFNLNNFIMAYRAGRVSRSVGDKHKG